MQAQTGESIFPLAGFSLRMLGLVWLIACLALLSAAILLAIRRSAWAPVALAGVALSQLVIVLWWYAAWVGTMAKLIILAAIAWQVARGAWARAAGPYGHHAGGRATA